VGKSYYRSKNFVFRAKLTSGKQVVLCYKCSSELDAKARAMNRNNVDKILETLEVSDKMYKEFLAIADKSYYDRRK
jgi:hypothetical protein